MSEKQHLHLASYAVCLTFGGLAVLAFHAAGEPIWIPPVLGALQAAIHFVCAFRFEAE